jgi:hypothetical protein
MGDVLGSEKKIDEAVPDHREFGPSLQYRRRELRLFALAVGGKGPFKPWIREQRLKSIRRSCHVSATAAVSRLFG